MIQRESLSIKLFSECNYDCSFCIQKEEKKYNCINLLPILKKHLEKYSYRTICILGGEPLLIPSYVVQLCDMICAAAPDTRIQVLTNGSLLTRGLVGYFNKINASILLSIHGATGEKSLSGLIQKANDPGMYETLCMIEDLMIRKVVTRGEENTADDIVILRTLFKNSIINVTPDYTTLAEFDIKDLFELERGIAQIHRLYNGEVHWLLLNSVGSGECSCKHSFVMHSDGSVVTLAEDTGVHGVASGCAMFQQKMGDENYRLYQKTLSRYFKGDM